MPKGPQGQKRPTDGIGAAVIVAQIATGEVTEALLDSRSEYWLAKKRSAIASAGGDARASSLTPERRSEIARDAARARWGN